MAVKKTTKKITKRATTKKAPPKPRKITVDELYAVLETSIQKLSAENAKTEASIRRLSVENAKTEASIRELSVKTEASIREFSTQTEASIRELSAQNDRTSDEVRKTVTTVRELTKNMGGLNNSFGFVVELVVIPKLRSAINTACGFTFTNDKVLTDKDYTAMIDGDKKTIGEVDMFLFTDTEAMAVEIKAQLNKDHVTDHINRLQKLRKYEDRANIAGKTLFGAIAGIYVDPEAKTFALENGLYLVNILEEEDKLSIEKPESRRTW
jgi:hypothetical protein